MAYTITFRDGTKKAIGTEQGFWEAIDVLVLEILALPPDERSQEMAYSGDERQALKLRMGGHIAQIIEPGSIEQCCALIAMVPSFFDSDLFSQRDGSVSASRVFKDAIEQELCSSIEERWDVYVELASKQTGRDIAQELVPPPPPDPYANWTLSRWLEAYTMAPSPETQMEIRRHAQARGVDISGWPVAAELRARFRQATQEKRYEKRFMLRQEAAFLNVDTSDWDHPDRVPEDKEMAVRTGVLAALEQSERPPIMGGYCQLLVSFASQARGLQATNLEQALMATARFWLEHCIEPSAWFLLSLPEVIKQEQGVYQKNLSLWHLARVQVLRSMERLLRRHTAEADVLQ